VQPLFEELRSVLESINDITYSVLYVDDGSKDQTFQKIKELAERWGEKIHYIQFARNFGKEAAIYAGLSRSCGDYVVLMDADLQHPPELIPEMLAAMEEGYDCCGARRVDRGGEPLIRSFFSTLFYKMINRITAMRLVPGGSDYRMMTRKMVDAVVSLSERERFTKGIMSWVGFDTKWITYENVERFAGKTKWSFMGLVKYAWNGFLSFATTPLRAAIYLGVVVVIAAVIYFFVVFIQALEGIRVWTEGTTLILLLLVTSGIIIAMLGVIGEYLARIYLELKQRPIYIEKESNIKSDWRTK
jgi:glycosyltransferase involved in cell wall biosynthesis